MLADMKEDIRGKHVLLVEDIMDSGVTIDYLKKMLQDRGPESLKVCVLLDKPDRRKVQIEADYAGFRIPNKYVVGYVWTTRTATGTCPISPSCPTMSRKSGRDSCCKPSRKSRIAR